VQYAAPEEDLGAYNAQEMIHDSRKLNSSNMVTPQDVPVIANIKEEEPITAAQISQEKPTAN
jgi:hypothetical protein